MRSYLLTFLLLCCLVTFSQKKYKPTIVVLTPYDTQYDTSLADEIQKFNYQTIYTTEQENYILDSLEKGKKNIRIMDIAEFHFRKQMDFPSYFTLSLFGMLTYMVFGQTENCVVIPTHEKADSTRDILKAIAKKYDVNWVVNPLIINTFKKYGNIFTSARIQVYNFKKNKIVLDKIYTGDTNNPGFELTCESGTLNCTISNIINPSLHDILITILGRYQH